MMKSLIPVLLFSPLILSANLQKVTEQKAKRELDAGYEKNAIADYQTLLKDAPVEKKSGLLKELSIAYLLDQDLEKAFSTYLEALDTLSPPKEPYVMTENEERIYHDALKVYLDPRERDTHEIAIRIKDLYAGILRLHPEYYSLGFLVSIAYANLDKYEKFFEIFYPSYAKMPDHYLSYKTKSILNIKVFERAKTPEEKQAARGQILKNLQLAKEKYPIDPSLYRLQIVFAPQDEKLKLLKENLSEIITHNMIVPRSDLSFYFDQLFTYGQIELAKEFLAKASGWYPYSRTLEAAKELLEEKEKESQMKEKTTDNKGS